jgi:hypothetical protein
MRASGSYIASAAFQVIALPFLILARREDAASDEIKGAVVEDSNMNI